MPTFIKTGLWEKLTKGYKGWLNLDDLITSVAGPRIPGPQGPIGPQGIQGPQGTAGNSVTILGSYANYAAFLAGAGSLPGAEIGDAWILTSDGSLYSWNGTIWFDAGDIQGPPGAQGPIGPQGVQGVQANLLAVPTDILPDADNTHSLGSVDHRWESVHIGPGTIYITDTVTGLSAGLTVTNGVLLVDGVSLMSVAGVKFSNNSVQTVAYVPATTQTFNPLFTDLGGALAGVTSEGHYTMVSPKVCFFRVKVFFDNCTNFGTTQYQFTLPFPSVETLRTGNATIHRRSDDTYFHIAGIADRTASLSVMKLYYSGSTTDLAWKNTTPVGATTTSSHFDISGVYEIA